MSYLQEDGSSSNSYRNGQRGNSSSSNVMSSVDLFTGNVKLPLSLAFLEGRDGLTITVQAEYLQSNPENFNKQNRMLSNFVLGYNWNISLPAIVVRNRLVKQSYQREFYLIGEGGQYPLYRIGRKTEWVEFISIEHPNWKFYFYEEAGLTYWEVLKEDGSRYRYGGSSDSNEQTVCWDNWVGPVVMNGAESFTTAWHLSMVESSKGNEVLYEYDNVMETLADCSYTRTVRLKRIISSYEEELIFCYEDKESCEYGVNHNSYDGENAYQERYEDKFLDRIEVLNDQKKLLYTQKLSYDTYPSGENEKKRLLKSITQVMSDGTKMPPLSLSYSEEKEYTGMLKSFMYPLASEVAYEYEKYELPNSDGHKTFEIEGGWDIKVHNGSDFNFILLRRDNHIKFQIYYWDMGWHQYEDATMLDIPVEDVKVYLGGGYVCITYLDLLENNYKLRIIKRCPVRRLDWDTQEWLLENSDTRPVVACGSDFVAFQYTKANVLKILQYKYTDNKWHENSLQVESREFQAIGAGDGFLFGAYGNNGTSQVRLMSFYSDEDHEWQFGDTLDVSVNVDWKQVMSDYVWSIRYSHAGACFISYKDNIVKTTMVLLAWTDRFKFTKFEVHDFKYEDDIKNQYFYAVATDTLIGYAENVYRYCPNGWKAFKLMDTRPGGEYRYAYGSDVVLGVESLGGVQRFHSIRFDPYTQEWTRAGVPESENLYQIDGICQPLIVDEYAVLGRKIFTRNVDECWNCIGYLEDNTDYENVQIDMEGGYLLYQLKGYDRVYQIPLENNNLSSQVKVCDGERIDMERSSGYQASLSGFYTFNSNNGVTAVNFYQLHEKKYSDKHSVILLKCVTCDNGFEKENINILYNLETARLEGGKAAMQSTCVCPVSEDGSSGKTEYRYFNGAGADAYAYPDDEYTNVKKYYSHMCGRLSCSLEYDGDGNLVAASENWLKAMDTLGFNICQTKITDSKYLRSYSTEDCNERNTVSEIKIITIVEYEDKFNLKRKVTRIGTDIQGNEVKISNEMHYLWEENEKLLQKNALSDISMTIKKEDVSGEVLEVNRYKYEYDSEGRHYLSESLIWDKTGDYTKDEGNWICINRITQVNENCDKVCEEDIEGLSTVYIYDKNNKFITAKFDNATPEEVYYCGFESYEACKKISMENGSLSDCLNKSERFSGTQSAFIEKNNKMSVNIIRNGTDSRISFSVKTNDDFNITWGNPDNKQVLSYPSTKGKWKRINAVLPNPKKEKGPFTVTISGMDNIYVDALFLSPLLSQGEAYVYSTDFMIQTASHKNYGQGARIFYDRFHNPIATAGDDGTFIGYSRKCYGRKQTNPALDETLSIEMPKGGCFQWLEQDMESTEYWQRDNSVWTFNEDNNLALFFAVHSGKQAITYGELNIEASDTEWVITYNGNIVSKTSKPKGKHYLFLKVGNRIQFSCEDVIIYSRIQNVCKAYPTVLKTEKVEDLICIGYCKDPKIVLSYTDYSGKSHQDIGVTETGIVAGQTIYNKLGQGEITTKKIHLEGEMWQYRKNLVTSYDWNTGLLEGEIAEAYPEDHGFSYSQLRSTIAPNPEPLEFGQAGTSMAIKGERNTARFGSYTNNDELFGLKEKTYRLTVGSTPDNIVKVEVMDAFDNKVMSLSKNSTENNCTQVMKYEYDYNGNLIRVYFPNYFTDIKDNHKYVSEYVYDGLGRLISQKEPDTQIVKFIYDRAGKLRFKKTDINANQYLYYVYDKYTREIEEGLVEGIWDEQRLLQEAELIGVVPENAKPKIKYYYDGDGNEISLIRRLHCIETYNDNGILETKEEYAYDEQGNICRKTTISGDNVDVVKMEYDKAGNVLEYSFGDTGCERIGYKYDIQARLVGISYMDNIIYSCSYLAEGNVSEERFLPGQSNELQRQYLYDSAMWLRKLKDRFFEQELEYDGVSDKAGLGGKITKSTSRFLNNVPDNINKEITYNYTYDSYGRLSGYIRNNKKYTLQFDANGNQTGENGSTVFSYEAGTNKLLSCKEEAFQYDNSGNINLIRASGISLEYDSVLNKVKSISKGDNNITYTYGSQGNTSFTDARGTTYVNNDDKGRVLSELRDGKRIICVYGASGMVAQIYNKKVYYLIKDYQSSVREIYDGENILALFNYDPFGNFEDNRILDASVNELIPIRFTSARYEEEIGLYRMRYRLYDPRTGRFLNADPENQHTSPYIYGGADWVNYFDPDGAISIGSILSIVGGVLIVGIGAAISIGTAGMGSGAGVALGLLGAGLVGTGIGFIAYGTTSAISDDFDIVDCLIYGGIGFIGGVVGAGVGAGISAITPVIGATASGIIDIGTGIVIGGTDSLISNGLINIKHSKDFFDNWEMNLTIGCVVGGVAAGFSGMSSSLRNNRAFMGRNAKNTIGVENHGVGRFGHLRTTYKDAANPKRYADYSYRPGGNGRGKVANDYLHTPNRYRSLGEHAMKVNSNTMEKFSRNGARINLDYSNAPRLREISLCGPNCTTYVIDRLAGGGINMPIWIRSPSLVHRWAALICKFQ